MGLGVELDGGEEQRRRARRDSPNDVIIQPELLQPPPTLRTHQLMSQDPQSRRSYVLRLLLCQHRERSAKAPNTRRISSIAPPLLASSPPFPSNSQTQNLLLPTQFISHSHIPPQHLHQPHSLLLHSLLPPLLLPGPTQRLPTGNLLQSPQTHPRRRQRTLKILLLRTCFPSSPRTGSRQMDRVP